MSVRLTLAVLTLSLSQLACGWKLETQPLPSAQAESTAENQVQTAPRFSLANDDGSFVSLDELLAAGKPAILVFYRGHW